MSNVKMNFVEDMKVFTEGKSIIIFDVETTGFNDDDDITQLAIMKLKSDLTIEETVNIYIDTDREISGEVISITGVNNMKLKYLSEGKRFNEQLVNFLHYFTEDSIFIAHNAKFDVRMMKSNMLRAGYEWKPKEVFCTMNSLKEEIGLRMRGNAIKPPNLKEAYRYGAKGLGLTMKEVDDEYSNMYGEGKAHDALYDVFMTYVAFAYLKGSRG